jgi:CBS domain-containing protein
MTTVAELMKFGLITVRPEARLGEVARTLLQQRIHAALVAEPGGPPLGIVSDVDLLAGEWLAGDARALDTLRRLTAREMMSTPVWTIEAAASAEAAIARMRDQKVHRLVVLRDGQACGVVSVSDFVGRMGRPAAGRANVGEAMSRGIVVCRQDTPLPALARAMTERRSRSVVVVGPGGQPLGVVAGVDLLAAWPGDESTATAADFMRPPVTIGPEASLSDAADLMYRHHIHRLVVVDPAQPDAMPLGLISTSDIMAVMAAPGSAWQVAGS